MQANGIITLTTDFGLNDSYVGIMKGVILGIAPRANIVDITHDIKPQNTAHAAHMVQTFYRYFPAGTVHLVIVDPGVGSTRRALAFSTPEGFFVGPDNGALTPVWHDSAQRAAVQLTEARFWRPEVSKTFHGRDIFAPVAAHLALGTPLEQFGTPIEAITEATPEQPKPGRNGGLVGRIVHVDHFGNCVTNITPRDLQAANLQIQLTVGVIDQKIKGLSETYTDGDVGNLIALLGSSGRLEISVRNGNAARVLGVGIGDMVQVLQQ